MKQKLKRYSPDEKVAILRRHLLEQVPVSELCREHDLHPNHPLKSPETPPEVPPSEVPLGVPAEAPHEMPDATFPEISPEQPVEMPPETERR